MGYCNWPEMSAIDRVYHDTEWGVPIWDDRAMFEHLSLECMQCGLSWDLMLKKRSIMFECFEGYDYDAIAKYGEFEIERILATDGMIRSRRKIEAIVANASRFLEVRAEFGTFCDYLWGWTDRKSIVYRSHDNMRIPAGNPLSSQIAADLKKRGFRFVGAITMYAHLQACGMINDHDRDCPRFQYIVDRYPTVVKKRGY
ncbi:MAG: DNA-3-methyladenine glycosylase I [Thermoguttaceae bacterium]|nr:DNA-3-methyladenine glycosylase I [Thermoguttaceae bacterium]